MDSLVQQQIEKNRAGLDHQQFVFRNQKPCNTHPCPKRKAFTALSEIVHFVTAFVLIFGSLMAYSNWKAYSIIAQDWIDSASASPSRIQIESGSIAAIPSTNSQELSQNQSELHREMLANLNINPPGTWLEIPKVYEGRIPVGEVSNPSTLDFAEDYNKTETEFQQILRKGVLHYPYTAKPGEFGNVFITGHSSYYPWAPGKYKEVFALLHKLVPGDQFFIYSNSKRITYTVTNTFEVEPRDVSVLSQPKNKKEATLMTCTPVGTTLRRLIVKAEQTDIQN